MFNIDPSNFSREYVSKIADDVRNQYSNSFPINTVEIANNLGLTVYTYNEPNPDISGILDPQNKKIYINGNDYPLRQKFSTAHEIGHWVLDYGCKAEPSDVPRYSYRNLLSSQGVNPSEMRANFFAACLLMPEDIVMRAWIRNAYDIDNTANELVVSRMALAYRLEYLGLLNE